MTKGILVTKTEAFTATRDERVVDSRAKGSWKIAKRMTMEFKVTRSAGPAVSRVESTPHELTYTPAYIVMVEHDSAGRFALYNIPFFQSTLSCKFYVDDKKVYASVVCGLTGTFTFKYKILLLGEKIE